MKIHRAIAEPIRANLTWEECWKRADQGMIVSWERGREKSIEDPELASQARTGQLVMLPWKGGFEKAIKKKEKYGSLHYLAMWQGLRGEDLNIDIEKETRVTCAVTKMTAIFTNEFAKYANA